MKQQLRQQIRENYKNWTPRSDPYQYADWLNIFTPIEKNVWIDIRFLGVPFYPQFPIGQYFADFADPVKKIVIEVDGKEFHKDEEKDKVRQREIESKGWKVYRIKGKQTFLNDRENRENEEELESESERTIREIKKEHYYIETEED